MPLLIQYVTAVASLGTVLLGAASLWLLYALISKKGGWALDFLAVHKFLISFAIVFMGAGLSFFYSEVAGFVPCSLCWWQRVFLYPQVFIFAIAAWRKDLKADAYGLALSAAGALLAAYHSYLQFGGSPLIPCSANTVSCAQRYFLEFGYVTIPTMSLTAFIAVILLMLIKDNSRK